MDRKYKTPSCRETAFGRFVADHVKLIIVLLIAMPFIAAMFDSAPDEPVRTVWISDATTLAAYESRARFMLESLEARTEETQNPILTEASGGQLARFDEWHLALTKGFPPEGEMSQRVRTLNQMRERISRLARMRGTDQMEGFADASGPAP